MVPGTIHEGGELGYALATAFGAALDNPDLIVACIVGDGEAETGPTATAWHSTKFLNPAGDGAVLPILHLNGYKIANPTIFKTMSDEELTKLFEGYGWHPLIVAGEDLDAAMADALTRAHTEIRELQESARAGRQPERPRWPMIILRSPKGWTGIKELDGVRIEGTSKAHQVPAMDAQTNPAHLEALEGWLHSYRPEELFEDGGPKPEIVATCPTGELRMGANPHVNSAYRPLTLPDLDAHAVDVEQPGAQKASALGALGSYLADVFRQNADERDFRIVCPDEVASNRLDPVFEAADHVYEWPLDPEVDTGHAPRRADHGDPLRAHLPGMAAGLRPDRPPRRVPMLRGVHPDRRRDGQPVREVPEDVARRGAVAQARRLAELPSDVRRLAPGPQRLLAPDAGLHQLHAQPQGGQSPGSTCRPTPTRCWRRCARAWSRRTASTSSSPPSTRCPSG